VRLKTLPRSCDGYGILIVSGFPVIRPANGVEQHKGTSKNGLLDRFAELDLVPKERTHLEEYPLSSSHSSWDKNDLADRAPA
jgi:hypothetical protein